MRFFANAQNDIENNMNILEEIISYKKIEIERNKERLPLDKFKKTIKPQKTNFYQIIRNKIDKKEIALIAEIKKASPSKGLIRADFNHIEIAKAYKNGGATCLSVLTDEKYFQGNINYIKEIKQAEAIHELPLPVLRKDFIIDPYQIYESIYYGADCILLIVGAFPAQGEARQRRYEMPLLRDLYEIACENKIDTLIEVHDEREMEIALGIVGTYCNTPIGINNRDLKTFKTDLNVTKNLVTKYKRNLENKIIVSESGIFTNDDIKSLVKSGVYAFLVGESLMRENNIENATRQLIKG